MFIFKIIFRFVFSKGSAITRYLNVAVLCLFLYTFVFWLYSDDSVVTTVCVPETKHTVETKIEKVFMKTKQKLSLSGFKGAIKQKVQTIKDKVVVPSDELYTSVGVMGTMGGGGLVLNRDVVGLFGKKFQVGVGAIYTTKDIGTQMGVKRTGHYVDPFITVGVGF